MEVQYKIIGGDGREYGPVTLEELRGWVRDGRVSGATHVWRGDSATWAPASTYVELASELGVTGPLGAQAAPASSAAAMEEARPVGFWARLAAYIVDAIILSIAFSLVWQALILLMHWQIPQVPIFNPATAATNPDALLASFSDYLEKLMPFFIPYFLIAQGLRALYEVLLNGRYGATLGKMAIGARIVRLDGAPIGYKIALLRWLAARVSDILCYAGYLFIAFRGDKRALHDLIVGTKVIFKR